MKFDFPGVLAEQTVGGQVSWMCSWIGESLSLLTYPMLKTDTVLLESMTLHATTWLSNEILVQLYPSESISWSPHWLNLHELWDGEPAFPASLFVQQSGRDTPTAYIARQLPRLCWDAKQFLKQKICRKLALCNGAARVTYKAFCLKRFIYVRKCVEIITRSVETHLYNNGLNASSILVIISSEI